MSGTVWGRRFGGRGRNPVLEAFNASISKDRFLAGAEVRASEAYARGLHKAGVLTDAELADMLRGLAAVGTRIAAGEDLSRFEDIHTAVELLLTDEIGDPGKKLHTGRSRNEQVATDERIFLKTKVGEAIGLIEDIQRALVASAEKHFSVLMPGYTHLQRGQVILYSHHLMSFFWPLERGKARLREALGRVDVLPLGSGALAGSTAALDREHLAEILGFGGVSENSIDAVADRTFILDVLFALTLVLLDLGRMASDFVLFASAEFGFVALDDGQTTSSSLMPQKKNPDVLELVRAAPSKPAAHLVHLLFLLKGLPSSYNKDLQEDKEPLERGVEEALVVLKVIGRLIPGVTPVPERMLAAIDPSLYATDLADHLVAKGVPFREAHGCCGEAVRFALERGISLDALTVEDFRSIHPAFGPDVRRVFDPEASVLLKRTAGSTHPEMVRDQIGKAKALVGPTRTSP